ncbi:MAG: LacI family transcriptional regulator [Bifidobacterium sp.]|jgi:LacI family transcriptional regulator|nr:LacI family transcriptional regulator [Bifidobacterium sp.]MCI1864611.1 LacI family transcriptional regulator [Bifidobacterium sp.]
MKEMYENSRGDGMAKKPTVYDVAREADVSIATVSRALRTPDSVRPRTRAAISRAIEQLGYVPSGSAQSLAERRTNTIGLFLPNIDELEHMSNFELESRDEARMVIDPPESEQQRPDSLYFDEVLRGCELESWRQGLSLMVNIGFGRPQSDVSRLVGTMSGKVDGLIILARSAPKQVLEFLHQRMPLVMIANAPSEHEEEFDVVRVSNRKGMSALVTHLVEAHHVSRLAYMAGPDDSPDNHKRYEGFCEGMRKKGLNPGAAPIYRGQFSQQTAYAITQGLIEQHALPQALVCANDQMGLGALHALTEAQICVPDTVIVTGFDGIQETETSRPRLTTVRQPMIDLGRAAVSTLVRRLGTPDGPPLSTELPVSVLLRESCEGNLAARHPESAQQ